MYSASHCNLVREKQRFDASPQSEESLCKPVMTSCAKHVACGNRCCFDPGPLDIAVNSCIALPETLGMSGYRFLSYLIHAQLESLGFAFTLTLVTL